MLTDLLFDFELENENVFVGRYRLVKPIFGAKYVQLVNFISTRQIHFVVTCDLIDDFLSNNEHSQGKPVLGMSYGGLGEYPLIPISRDTINDITVRMFHFRGYNLSRYFTQFVRVLLRIFHEEPTSLLEMKQTAIFLRLERTSKSVMYVNYRFPKPLHGVKWVRALSWVNDESAGYDLITCPILADPCLGNGVDEPILAFGRNGELKMCEAKRVAEQHSTMNNLIIKMVRPGNTRYGLDYALIHLVIFNE